MCLWCGVCVFLLEVCLFLCCGVSLFSAVSCLLVSVWPLFHFLMLLVCYVSVAGVVSVVVWFLFDCVVCCFVDGLCFLLELFLL